MSTNMTAMTSHSTKEYVYHGKEIKEISCTDLNKTGKELLAVMSVFQHENPIE
jgi:hypothetical protein